MRIGTVRDQEGQLVTHSLNISLPNSKGLRFKGSFREVEAWNHEDSLGEVTGESTVQLQKNTQAFLRYQY